MRQEPPPFAEIVKAINGRAACGMYKLQTLYNASKEIMAKVSGACAELGVYKGGTAYLIGRMLPQRRLYLFDTFTGIPQKGEHDLHNIGDFGDTTLEAVKQLVDRPAFYKVGIFPETLDDQVRAERFALIHLDMDQYAATRSALNFFWPRMSLGGRIVLDDYKWHACPGIELAVTEFMKHNTETKLLLELKNQAVLTRVC